MLLDDLVVTNVEAVVFKDGVAVIIPKEKGIKVNSKKGARGQCAYPCTTNEQCEQLLPDIPPLVRVCDGKCCGYTQP